MIPQLQKRLLLELRKLNLRQGEQLSLEGTDVQPSRYFYEFCLRSGVIDDESRSREHGKGTGARIRKITIKRLMCNYKAGRFKYFKQKRPAQAEAAAYRVFIEV